MAALVPPDGHGEHHTPSKRVAHLLHGTKLHEAARVCGLAELVVHVVDLRQGGDVDGGVFDDAAVLDVQAVDLAELALLVGNELGDDGEGLARVDNLAGAVVVPLVDAVGVVAAAGLVADTLVSALLAGALVETLDAARVRSQVCSTAVGFPNVHFIA